MVYKYKKFVSLLPYLVSVSEDSIIDKTLVNGDGCLQVCPVDEFSGQEFMQNENGFPMNDIMAFEESASDSVARAALARLQVLHPDNMPVGTSPQDLLRSIVPANFSTPAEYMKIQAAFAKDWYSRVVAQKEQKPKEESIDFKPSDEPKVD